MTENLNITIEHKESMIVIILDGALTMHTVKRVESFCIEEIKKNPGNLILDMYNVTFIDSTAVSILVKLLNHAVSHKVKLILYNLNHTTREILDTLKLTKFFTVFTKAEFESAIKAKA